jgi:hypothetical protein
VSSYRTWPHWQPPLREYVSFDVPMTAPVLRSFLT